MDAGAEAGADLGARSGRSLVALTIISFLGLFIVAFDATLPNVALPLMLKSLHMSLSVAGLAVTMTFVGASPMFFFSGVIMDRWGRKKAFLLVLLGTAVFSALTAGVASAWELMLVRFLAGTSLALIGIVAVLLAEEASAANRGLMVGLVQAAYPAGAIAASTIATGFLSHGQWRPLFLFAFIPALVLLAFAWRIMREPRRFEVVAAVKGLRGAEGLDEADVGGVVDVEKARRFEWGQLFAPDLRRQSVVMSAYSFFVAFGTNMLVAWSVTYLTLYDHLPIGLAALALAVESAATLVGQFGSGWLADYLSSRYVLAVFAVLGGVSIFLFAVRGDFAWILVPMIAGGLFGQGLLGCLPRYAADAVPTRARGSGTALVSGMHFFAPLFTGVTYGAMMGAHLVGAVPILAGSVTVAGGLIVLLGRSIAPRQELEKIAI